jgi:hypothetical protein
MQLLLQTTIDSLACEIRRQSDDDYLSILELLVCIPDSRLQRITSLAAPVLQNFCNKFIEQSNSETRGHG